MHVAVKTKPSYPNPSDQHKPTNPHLWDIVLEVASGKRREYTQYGRTIHAPNDGRGYLDMPAHPQGIAWAVKQYNGFGGLWKDNKEAGWAAPLLRLAAGGVEVTEGDSLETTTLAARGLIRKAGERGGRTYWDLTPKGFQLVASHLTQELEKRVEQIVRHFDPSDAKALGVWIENNFRILSPRTPKGGKEVKEKMLRMVWVLKHRFQSAVNPNLQEIAGEVEQDWNQIKSDLPLLFRFTDEAQVVPPDLSLDGILYVNEVGVDGPTLERYAKRLAAVFKQLQGWRRKALVGNVKVVLKPPRAFQGTTGGVYKRQLDEMWIRTTPTVLKRGSGGYGSFEFILVHELGHRYERHNNLPANFDTAEWATTRYSLKEGEAFAELFALGHFGFTGSWNLQTVRRFEEVMP